MTGFGEGRCEEQGREATVEVRTINSRYFKLSLRTGENYGSLEPRIESLVRKAIRRGTVQVTVRVDQARTPDEFKINTSVLEGYRGQLDAMREQWQLPGQVPLEALLSLPGVVDDAAAEMGASGDWPLIARALGEAMEQLDRMRRDEGEAMAADLKTNCSAIAASLERIRRRAPDVVAAYRSRLEDRVRRILAERDVELDPADVIREISLFAERSDISEEIVRLQSHLDQFDEIMRLPEASGRKLEFVTQEMFREANTIGSKANDVEISRHVIDVKAAVERLREMIQNIE